MQSLDPYAVSPKEMQELIGLHAFLDCSGLDESLMELVRLHVSLLNGSARGAERHARRASALGESHDRLAALREWRRAALFTEKERAALEWSEAVTFVAASPVPDEIQASIRQWFTDVEVVTLTMVVAATTAWNRVEMSFSRHRKPSTAECPRHAAEAE